MGMVRLRGTIGIETVVPLQLQLQLQWNKTKTCFLKTQSQSQPQSVGCRYRRRYSCTSSIEHSMSSEDATATAIPTPTPTATAAATEEDVVVQYVVLRRDLIDTWPLGSVVTQGCHASVAAIWQHKDDPSTLAYCSPSSALDSMHKVTLEVKGEPQIVNLSEKLNSNGILHHLWIEQPENIPTCLATKPYPKSLVSPFFRRLKLCK